MSHRSLQYRTHQAKLILLSLLVVVIFCTLPAQADYTVTVDPKEDRGTWEGWGCSLSWWGNGIGGSAYEDLYSDLFFTQKTVSFMDKPLPGLGLNIIRYNVGGSGRNNPMAGDRIGDTIENDPPQLPWYKKVEGFWVNGYNPDPASNSWDWTRDARQRRILRAAQARGVDKIEFFSDSPMWWMMDHQSAAGGSLLPEHNRDHARYLAAVVRHARDNWGVKVTDIEAFNEPSAGWWNYPTGQEGCNIFQEQQADILADLREELDARGLQATTIAASDENDMHRAKTTYGFFQTKAVSVHDRPQTVASLVGKVNVHGYYGMHPWRDNVGRQTLRQAIGSKWLWMSEFGDGDGGDMTLAQQITEDINYLRPTAWVYWQPVEPGSTWGFVNGIFGKTPDEPDRGKPTWVYTKYYVMAQFSRFLRPGDRILGSSDNSSIIAYDPHKHQTVLITVNYGTAQTIHYDLSSLPKLATSALVTETNTNGSKNFQTSSVLVTQKTLTLQAEANSIYSIVIGGVQL